MKYTITQWLQSPRGSALLNAEKHVLSDSLEDCFGWQTLQIGAWGDGRSSTLLANGRTRSQAVVAGARATGDILARLTQLPIASDSIDAVILPHTLEFELDPYALLREAERILAGDGKLLILGFAPWSPWGLRATATRLGFPPELRRVISEWRLRDWLKLLGFELLGARRYLYELPWGKVGSVQEEARRLRRGWLYPLPASGYLLKARKCRHALTPLRSRLRERRTMLGGFETSSAKTLSEPAPLHLSYD